MDEEENETESRKLECKLTDEELAAKATELDAAVLEYEQVDDEYKEVASGYRKRLKGIRALSERLAKQRESGVEERDVDCEWRPDYEHNCFRLHRLDTGEEIDQRAMDLDDRQEGMAFDGPGEEGAPVPEQDSREAERQPSV